MNGRRVSGIETADPIREDGLEHKHSGRRVVLAFLLMAAPLCFAQGPTETNALVLQPIHHLKVVEGKQRFAALSPVGLARRGEEVEGIAFRAVVTNRWPVGLIPIFAVEGDDAFELRRLPKPGQENMSDPLFFALPPLVEPEVVQIAGSWDVRATRGDNNEQFFGWDLTAEGETIAGRFDQYSDYRFASLTGGRIRPNQMELRVEYLKDAYLLTGERREGKWTGRWHHSDNFEQGVWQATRRIVTTIPTEEPTALLFEWRAEQGMQRRYLLEDRPMGEGWQRAAKPLCRVWR